MAPDGHAEKVAELEARLQKLAEERTAARLRRATPRPQAASPPVELPAPPTAGFRRPGRFHRLPEVVLAVIGLAGLWFVPSQSLADLVPGFDFIVLPLIPVALLLFVVTGAAIWRAFQEF
jgi:hypothetical protein